MCHMIYNIEGEGALIDVNVNESQLKADNAAIHGKHDYGKYRYSGPCLSGGSTFTSSGFVP